MFVGRCTKRNASRVGCVCAAKKVFAGQTLVGDASTYIVGLFGGEPRRKIVTKMARRRHSVVDMREREGKSYLYDMVLDLIFFSQFWR